MTNKHVLLALKQDHNYLKDLIIDYANSHQWTVEYYGRNIPLGWYGDGVITDYFSKQELQRLRDPTTTPIISRSLVPHQNIRSVVGNTEEIARLVCDYFIQRGFTHFASVEATLYINPNNVHPNLSLANELVRRGFDLIQYCWHEHLKKSEHDNYEAIICALSSFFKQLPKPCALFCPNIDYLHLICRACKEANIRIPHEIALLSNNEEPDITQNTAPPSSAIFGEIDDVGHRMALLLDKMMSGIRVPLTPQYVKPISIITRQSTDILAVPDLATATAINFLLSNYMNPISIKDASAAAGISACKMNQLFHRWVGKSPGELLRNTRMEKTCELLKQTDLTLDEIAQRTGYGSGMALSLAFRKYASLNPGEYRKQQK